MRGQSGLEYAAIVTLVLVAILPFAFFAYSDFQQKNTVAQSTLALEKLSQASEEVFLQGEGSVNQITLFLPDSVQSFTVSNREAQIQVNTNRGASQTIYRSSFATFTPASLPTTPGKIILSLTADNSGNVTVIS